MKCCGEYLFLFTVGVLYGLAEMSPDCGSQFKFAVRVAVIMSISKTITYICPISRRLGKWMPGRNALPEPTIIITIIIIKCKCKTNKQIIFRLYS